MNHEKLAVEFHDRMLRNDLIFHLGTMCNFESIPDVLETAFQEEGYRIFEAMGIDEPEHYIWPDEIVEHIEAHRKDGFLIKVVTPFPNFQSETSFSSSWRSYTGEWIYGETLEECFDKALAWRDAYIERKRSAFLSA